MKTAISILMPGLLPALALAGGDHTGAHDVNSMTRDSRVTLVTASGHYSLLD